MADFIGMDPRGTIVFLYETTWVNHVIVEHPELKANFEAVCQTMLDPDQILANTSGFLGAKRPGREQPKRKATERYIRHDATMNMTIMVPMMTTTLVELVNGKPVQQGALQALTAYPIDSIPPARSLWRRTK